MAVHSRPLRGQKTETAYILGGTTALNRVKTALINGLEELEVEVATVAEGVDTCTADCIDAHSRDAERHGADIVVGAGGGTALDVAKAVGERTTCDVVTVPTIASTDAPCSAVSIVYDVDGRVESPQFHTRNPTLVLADTSIIADAPERYLRYGIGDALATRFEAAAVTRANGETDAGGAPSHTAVTLAASTYDCLTAEGTDALAAARNGEVTPAFDRVVETVILRSGLGFESGGVAGAHAFHNGAVEFGVQRPHGELVCFGVVFQLALENRLSVAEEVVKLCNSLGLNLTLSELDIKDISSFAEVVANCSLMSNEPVSVTPTLVAESIRAANGLMREETLAPD